MAASTAWAIWRGSFRARTTRRAKYMGPCAFARKIVGWGATFNSVCRASTTTPTISTGLGTVQQTFSFLPTGFWPAKNREANAWLTTVALGVPKRSCWPKSRPLSMGVPMVWKYPGLITRKSALGEETFGSGPGAGAKQEPDTNPVSGRKCVEPAACTPGTLRTSSSTRSMYCDRFLNIGVPMGWKYPGLITRKPAVGEETFGPGPGGGEKQEPDTNRVGGRKCVEPAACTPGPLHAFPAT